MSSGVSFSNSPSDSSIYGQEVGQARTLGVAINALNILSSALIRAREHSATNGFALLNAIFPPDTLKYLIFAASVADRFVKNDALHQPISDGTTDVKSFATTTIDERVPSTAATMQSYLETTGAGPKEIQWLEEVFADIHRAEQNSRLADDLVSPISPIVSDTNPGLTWDSTSETSPYALDSPSQLSEPTCGFPVDSGFNWQEEYANNSFPYVEDLDYQLPIYTPHNVDPQTQQKHARAQWLAQNHEQISRDLGKSPLFSPSLINDHPVFSTSAPNDRLLRYSTNSSIHHPRPVRKAEFTFHQLLGCTSSTPLRNVGDPSPVDYAQDPLQSILFSL